MRRSSSWVAPPCALVIALVGIAFRGTTQTFVQASAAANAAASDSEAVAIYGGMLRAFTEARSLSWESAYEFTIGGVTQGVCSYRLSMKKPDYARMEAMMGGTVKGVLIGDGSCFWIYWPEGRPQWEAKTPNATPPKNQYMQDLIPANRYSIAHRAGMLGTCMVMLAFQPSVFHGMPDLLLQSQDTIRLAGQDTIDGESCDAIDIRMMDGQRARTLWVSRRDHLPRKAREVAHAAQELAVTEIWSKLQRDVDIPDSLFQWTPQETWTQYYEPYLDSQTIPPGNPAPEVDLPLGGGGRFRLSAMRGKVVLLNFWRVGCPPCRQEIPFLQELYTQRGGPGFVVVGVNTADDPTRVRALLAKCGANYPVIIDTTRAAADLVRQFGPDAVPLTYIIGIEGNVHKGWFGFDKEASPQWIREELESLGVH